MVCSPDSVGGGASVGGLALLLLLLGRLGRVAPLEDLPAQRVDRLALLVHDVVVLEQVLADVEVVALDLLCAFSIARLTRPCSIGTSSSIPSRSIRPVMRSAPKMRSRSSSSDR